MGSHGDVPNKIKSLPIYIYEVVVVVEVVVRGEMCHGVNFMDSSWILTVIHGLFMREAFVYAFRIPVSGCVIA